MIATVEDVLARQRHQRVGLSLVLWALLALAATWQWCDPAEVGADPGPLPAEQWTPQAHLELGRCVVGEAGFRATADHDAIAWVLARRWRQRSDVLARKGGVWTFAAQVRAYCKGAYPRQQGRQWVRDLPTPGGDWPAGAGPNLARWRRILGRLDRWARGGVPNPCPGAAHWGGMSLGVDLDRALRNIEAGRWEAVECRRPTLNGFLALAGRS